VVLDVDQDAQARVDEDQVAPLDDLVERRPAFTAARSVSTSSRRHPDSSSTKASGLAAAFIIASLSSPG
jgi:hypothetical protein